MLNGSYEIGWMDFSAAQFVKKSFYGEEIW